MNNSPCLTAAGQVQIGKGARRISSLSQNCPCRWARVPGHGDALRGVVLGVAAGAEDGQEALVGGVVGEVGDVEEAVGLAAALADIASGLEHRQPELAPAGIVELAVLG